MEVTDLSRHVAALLLQFGFGLLEGSHLYEGGRGREGEEEEEKEEEDEEEERR